MDQDVPQSDINFPSSVGYVSAIDAASYIYGDYNDTGAANPGSVSAVRIAVKRLGPPTANKWWNGTNLFNQDNIPTLEDADLWGSTWTYKKLTDTYLTSGTSYFMTVKALDSASPSNDEGFYSVRSVTFTFDNDPPTIVFKRRSTTVISDVRRH